MTVWQHCQSREVCYAAALDIAGYAFRRCPRLRQAQDGEWELRFRKPGYEESLVASREEARDLEEWLAEVAVPHYREILAEPSRGNSFEEVKADLAADLRSMQETHE